MRQYSSRTAKAGIPASVGKRALNTVMVGDASSIVSILALLLMTHDGDLERHDISGSAVAALVELWTDMKEVPADPAASSQRILRNYEAAVRLRSFVD